MKTQILKAYSEKDTEAINTAAEILKSGGLVAIPTETVYGLAGSAFSETAAKNIYSAKGRPSDNPLIVHISKLSELAPLVKEIPDNALRCMKKFWPGPFTAILPKSDKIPDSVSGGLDTVAIRMPENIVARSIISACGLPLAAPSANLSGSPSPTTAQYVIKDLDGRIDAIVASKPCDVGVESTVVTFATTPPRILRPGGITAEQLKSLVPDIVIDDAVLHEPEKDAKVSSPGIKYKHYSPKADITMFIGTNESFINYCNSHKNDYDYALCFNEDEKGLLISHTSLGKTNDHKSQAENLFTELRRLDDMGKTKVIAHAPNKDGIGLAVYNRLIRAAGFHVIE